MAFFLIVVPVAIILFVAFMYLLFSLLRTVLGLNGVKAMARFYWSLLIVTLWLSITTGFLYGVFAVFSPALHYLGNRESKGGALGPAIVIPLMLICLMAAPVVATKITASINRWKERK